MGFLVPSRTIHLQKFSSHFDAVELPTSQLSILGLYKLYSGGQRLLSELLKILSPALFDSRHSLFNAQTKETTNTPRKAASRFITEPALGEALRQSHVPIATSLGLKEVQQGLNRESSVTSGLVDDWFKTYARHTDIMTCKAQEHVGLGKVDWDRLVAHVQTSVVKDHLLDGLGWKPIRDVIVNGADEDARFRVLGDIAQSVSQAAIAFDPSLERTTVVRRCHNGKIASKIPWSSNMPDTCAALTFPNHSTSRGRRFERLAQTRPPDSGRDIEKLPSPDTFDIAMAAEFELFNTVEGRKGNEGHILDGASHILCNDPRRRFLHGLTIEAKMMRFWHFSRSHIATTEGFDYHQRPEVLIQFLLFVAFAPQHALGYDPTIKRIRYQDKIAYVYKVGEDWYQTIGDPLSEPSCLPIATRATRVWAVRKIIDETRWGDDRLSGEMNVLKDVWLLHDAVGEKSIQDAVFAKLGRHKKDAQKYFMTILADERVSVDGAIDQTPGPRESWGSAGLSTGTHHKEPAISCPQHNVNSVTSENMCSVPGRAPSSHSPRIHWRTVFQERGETVYDIQNIRDFGHCLDDVVKGLKYMHMAGFVHRDISGGNCLWYNGQGKISDLEYAKLYEQLSEHDARTGTPQFMAVECQARSHIFGFKGKSDNPGRMEKEDVKERSTQIECRKPQDTTFTFNFLHDLESVYWMFLWFLYHRIPSIVDPSAPAFSLALGEFHRMGGELFKCGISGNQTRERLVKGENAKMVATSLEAVYPYGSPCRFLLAGMRLTEILRNAYIELESTPPNKSQRWPHDAFKSDVYDQFSARLRGLAEDAGAIGNALVIPLRQILLSESLPKRHLLH